MSKSTDKLRLGPLPRTEMIKLTISMPTDLKASLDRYASLHSQAHGEGVDAAALIPHMLAAFIALDRGFKALRRDPVSQALHSKGQQITASTPDPMEARGSGG